MLRDITGSQNIRIRCIHSIIYNNPRPYFQLNLSRQICIGSDARGDHGEIRREHGAISQDDLRDLVITVYSFHSNT